MLLLKGVTSQLPQDPLNITDPDKISNQSGGRNISYAEVQLIPLGDSLDHSENPKKPHSLCYFWCGLITDLTQTFLNTHYTYYSSKTAL